MTVRSSSNTSSNNRHGSETCNLELDNAAQNSSDGGQEKNSGSPCRSPLFDLSVEGMHSITKSLLCLFDILQWEDSSINSLLTGSF